MTTAKEVYLLDHKWLEDPVLLAPPARGPFTALTLFVCTYVATLDNLHIDFSELTRVMCQRPRGCLLAVNSNYGHAAQPGFERYIKTPKPPRERRVPARGRARKVQGDGTCFNSAIEPVVAIEHPDLAEGKVYFMKCFPTTGQTQVPGVILPDLSDGHLVLEAFVAYLNGLGVGDEEPAAPGETPEVAAAAPGAEAAASGTEAAAPGTEAAAGAPEVAAAAAPGTEAAGAPEVAVAAAPGTEATAPGTEAATPGTEAATPEAAAAPEAPETAAAAAPEAAVGAPGAATPPRPRRTITIAREKPNMINYKFRLVRNCPRILVNLYALSAYLCLLEHTKAVEGAPLTPAQAVRFAGWPVLVLPPFPVRETKSPTDDVKVSFRFREVSRNPRLNIFQEGKVNILGADSVRSAELIYDFFVRLFAANWGMLVSLQPRRDLERRQALRAPLRPGPGAEREGAAPAVPPARLSDADLDELLAGALELEGDDRAQAASELLAPRARGCSAEAQPPLRAEAPRGLWEPRCGVPAAQALGAAVDEIVADLDAEEWGFEDDAEDDAGDDDAWYAKKGPVPGSQDPLLREVDREDVHNDQEHALKDDAP